MILIVLLQNRPPLVSFVQKKLVGVEHIVSQELENRTVILVAACLSNDTDVGARVAPKCCVIEARLHFEFFDGIRVRNRYSAASRC